MFAKAPPRSRCRWHQGSARSNIRTVFVLVGAANYGDILANNMRKASLVDVPQLVTMMTEFYSDSPYTLNPKRAAEAFSSLLADERLGWICFIQADSKDVGYVVVTLCYTMTYGGLSAAIDDLFVQPAF